MDKITITTTQNVSIEYEIGSLSDRILATVIDLLILFGYFICIGVINSIISSPFETVTWPIIVELILILPAFFYPLLCETFLNGQTLGKRARKIRVIRVDGKQPGFGNYLMRWLLWLVEIPFACGIIAIITIVLNGKGQRLGDLAAGTAVIKIRENENIRNTAFENIHETYVPVFQQAGNLSDDEATLIRQVLNLKDEENKVNIQARLSSKLKELLKIDSALEDRIFLETLLRDFNRINGRL